MTAGSWHGRLWGEKGIPWLPFSFREFSTKRAGTPLSVLQSRFSEAFMIGKRILPGGLPLE